MYRTNSAPPIPMRPALALWQRVVVAVLPHRVCAIFVWFRAHIGGSWCYGARGMAERRRWRWEWVSLPFNECPVLHFAPADIVCACDRAACRCEVYPWPSFYSVQPPEQALDFAEYRKRYDRMSVVDLKVRRK